MNGLFFEREREGEGGREREEGGRVADLAEIHTLDTFGTERGTYGRRRRCLACADDEFDDLVILNCFSCHWGGVLSWTNTTWMDTDTDTNVDKHLRLCGPARGFAI